MTLRDLQRAVAKIRGVCLTTYINACNRRRGGPRRPCLVAYLGAGRTFKSKRFMVDTLGPRRALEAATAWRWLRSGVRLDQRTCDRARRKVRASISRAKK